MLKLEDIGNFQIPIVQIAKHTKPLKPLKPLQIDQILLTTF